jgi:hypothetical protein
MCIGLFRYLLLVLIVVAASASARHAYALFASSDVHACAALTVAHNIRSLALPHEDADIVCMVTRDVSQTMRSKLIQADIHVRNVEARARLRGYYEHAMVKIEPLQWYEYDRIIVLDADVFIQHSLDHLFQLPDVPLAAPVANWENEACITDALFVVQPSKEVWQKALALIPKYAKAQKADMVLLNELWEHRIGNCRILPEVLILPSRYLTLSTELTNPEPYHTDPTRLLHETTVFHFSGRHGKPWNPNTTGMNAATLQLYKSYMAGWQCAGYHREI